MRRLPSGKRAVDRLCRRHRIPRRHAGDGRARHDVSRRCRACRRTVDTRQRRKRSKSSRRRKEEPAPVAPPPPSVATATPVMSLATWSKTSGIAALTLPVQGLKHDDLRDTFNEMRGSSRKHEALDILAPRNTPVLAVEDGTVAKFVPERCRRHHDLPVRSHEDLRVLLRAPRALCGGLEGRRSRSSAARCIGYVGTTGNAPRDTPHLHFAIFKLTEREEVVGGNRDRSLFGSQIGRARLFEALDDAVRERRRLPSPSRPAKAHYPRLQLPIDHHVHRQADASVGELLDRSATHEIRALGRTALRRR